MTKIMLTYGNTKESTKILVSKNTDVYIELEKDPINVTVGKSIYTLALMTHTDGGNELKIDIGELDSDNIKTQDKDKDKDQNKYEPLKDKIKVYLSNKEYVGKTVNLVTSYKFIVSYSNEFYVQKVTFPLFTVSCNKGYYFSETMDNETLLCKTIDSDSIIDKYDYTEFLKASLLYFKKCISDENNIKTRTESIEKN